MKAIILYCSRTGNTENLVHRICRTIPADTLKVEPREPYGSYISSVLRVRKERKNNIIKDGYPFLHIDKQYDSEQLNHPGKDLSGQYSEIPFRPYYFKTQRHVRLAQPFKDFLRRRMNLPYKESTVSSADDTVLSLCHVFPP